MTVDRDTQAALVTEFDRLMMLVYGSMILSGLAVVAFIVALVYFARRLKGSPKVLLLYPKAVRLRVLFALGDGWTALVERQHVQEVRAVRHNMRAFCLACAVWIATLNVIELARHHWVARIQTIGEIARHTNSSTTQQEH
jgi:hypothetical protein